MGAVKKQFYNIKFPFTTDNIHGQFIDLNKNTLDKVTSQIVHVLLTQKRSRIRMPEFGTNLMKYVFEPNDELTWDNIKEEARNAVATYVTDTNLTNLDIYNSNDDDNMVYLSLSFTTKVGNIVQENKVYVKL